MLDDRLMEEPPASKRQRMIGVGWNYFWKIPNLPHGVNHAPRISMLNSPKYFAMFHYQ
jgi:hypothetical protein